jgi:hypothetical protein
MSFVSGVAQSGTLELLWSGQLCQLGRLFGFAAARNVHHHVRKLQR